MSDIYKSDRDRAVVLVELLFFAYRDFVADPDHLLQGLNFGRAHHRVLHFVGRNPGLSVASLLDILQITKQSLARVLKQLIAHGHIIQIEGAADRRQRLLHLSTGGEKLLEKLTAPQLARFQRAIVESNCTQEQFHAMLLHMINPENQTMVQEVLKHLPQRISRADD